MTVFVFVWCCGMTGMPSISVSEMHTMQSCEVAKARVVKSLSLSKDFADDHVFCLPGGVAP